MPPNAPCSKERDEILENYGSIGIKAVAAACKSSAAATWLSRDQMVLDSDRPCEWQERNQPYESD